MNTLSPSELRELRAAYRHFLREDRILLTGHSHQAWPDCAREAQLRAFDDAADLVDDKWGTIFELQASVARRINHRSGLPEADPVAFGESSHQLVYRLLSCFSLTDRPRVVASDAEFHSMYRQLRRLEEEGLEVVWVRSQPRDGLAERMVEAITPDTKLVALSTVIFEDGWVVEGIQRVAERALEVGAVMLFDAYHSYNCVEVDWGPYADRIYVTSGGYKYAGFGNGLCWLKIPRDCELRPAYTGWFSDFANLAAPRDGTSRISYGEGAARFAGSTFDASALYRADAVLRHWDQFGLSAARLSGIYRAHTGLISACLKRDAGPFEVLSSSDDDRRGPFVTVRHPDAQGIVRALRARGVWVDAREDRLRFGPAPYLTEDEIETGVARAVEVAKSMSGALR